MANGNKTGGNDNFYSLTTKDTWQTPDEIVSELQDHITITLDPCAGLFTFIGEENWTIEVPEQIPDKLEYVDSPNTYDVGVTNGERALYCGADSLSKSWDTGGIAYVNPPFSMKEEFVQKTVDEVSDRNIDGAIILTPNYTDVKSWWHGRIVPNAPVTWFSYGRVSFINPDTGGIDDNPTFGTALHFIGDMEVWPDSLFNALSESGDVVVRWREYK